MRFQDAQKKAVAMFKSPEFIKRIEGEDNTMLQQLSLLQAINAKGLLTTNSQAGRLTKGKSLADGKRYEISERAYIDGFMLEEQAEDFIKNISLNTDKVAVFVPSCTGDMYLPSKLDVPLTISKDEGKATIETHTSLAIPKEVWEFYRKSLKINKSEKVVYIFCWDPQWNRLASGKKGLFTEVLKNL